MLDDDKDVNNEEMEDLTSSIPEDTSFNAEEATDKKLEIKIKEFCNEANSFYR